MAVDKLVDSTQLDADLTSVANAIRTKGGTSASLAFPAGFVSAIGNIPGGGGVTAETGEIVVASDVASPTGSQSFTFPGLQLSFVPDFFFLAMTKASWDSIVSTAGSGHIYMMIHVRKSDMPVYRTGNTTNTDNAEYASYDSLFFVNNSAWSSMSTSEGYGISGLVCVDSTRRAYWGFNNDGILSYGRATGTSQTALYAGTYRYVAVKFS